MNIFNEGNAYGLENFRPSEPKNPKHKCLGYHEPKPKIGRNEPCPCGSGKKYKKCCGKED